MNDSVQKQLVVELGRDLVSKIAPQEMPLFQANSEAYFKDSQKVLRGQKGKDEMLGFGTGEVVTFLTPIVLVVMTEVVGFVTEEVKKSIKAESSNLISEAVKKMFKKFRTEEEKTLPSLTSEQLEQVRKLAFDRARQLKFSEAQARLMADSVMGSLVIGPG